MDKSNDLIDRLVEWGCRLLHLEKHRKFLTKLAKFGIAGVLTTAIDWVIFFTLCEVLHLDWVISQLFAFVASTIVGYFVNTKWVFETTKEKTRRRLVTEFFVFNFIALVMTEVMLYLFDKWQMNILLAKVITTTVTMIFNYITRKWFLEGHKSSSKKVSFKSRN